METPVNKLTKQGNNNKRAVIKRNDNPSGIESVSNKLTKKEIDRIKGIAREYGKAETVKEVLDLIENMDDATLKYLNTGRKELLSYASICDTGGLMGIKVSLKSRDNLIKEYDIKTTSEKILLDMGLQGYARYFGFQAIISTILDNKPFNEETALIIERLQRLSDSALNRFTSSLETIRSMKLIPIKVNINNSQINVGNNQQINTGIKSNNFGKPGND